MKRTIFIVLALSGFFAACVSNDNSTTCTDVAPSQEASTIQTYCVTNGINYTIDSSGIYYEIVDPGTTPKPTIGNNIKISYVAKYLNGTVLDQTDSTIINPLGSLIDAWQIIMPKIGKGGHVKMVAPSSLCYGCYGVSGFVPPNSIIYFDITLVDVL